jgi:hypothetical protein
MSVRPIVLSALVVATSAACSKAPTPRVDTTPEAPVAPEWQLLASGLPSALMSVDGTSASDVYAVGADKGDGPFAVHFDGKAWSRLDTGHKGDLWWVHAFPGGTALMAGSSATVLRWTGGRAERLPTPGLGRQTVYGVWGSSPSDFYAVGSAAGRDGFIWHYEHGGFVSERLPADLPRLPHGEVPGFFKVWGQGADVWVVGAAGAVLHRHGDAPFARVASGTTETLFTVHGEKGYVVAVGGSSNGVALDVTRAPAAVVSPSGAPLIQGVYATVSDGLPTAWASGERGMIYRRRADRAFEAVDHELSIPSTLSLHGIYVDPSGGVWSVGGDVLSPALDEGLIVHFGLPAPALTIQTSHPGVAMQEHPAMCPKEVVEAGKDKSIARRWDEQTLAAIRLDIPKPTVHSRNLFHTSAAMWDAWAAYDTTAAAVFRQERHHADDVAAARRAAISYAAYRVLHARYLHAVGGPTTVACLDAVMKDLGYDTNDTHEQGDDPIALGNRIAKTVLAATLHDGSDEESNYMDPTPYKSPNAPLVYDSPGTNMADPNVWQPLNLSIAATQNGIVLPAGVQEYIGSQWGAVTPFAMKRPSPKVGWADVGPTPKVGPAMKRWLVEVLEKTREGDLSDGVMIDISPGAYGHNSLGANDGKGWRKNPVTGQPYAPELVPRADFARVMAEFWADGPTSETPPGHWNVLANMVADSPGFARKLFGQGEPEDPLAWDVHTYLALNGAVHDAAIAAWDTKRRTVSSRPICLIRWMGAKGQSSDPRGPSYDPDGLPLVPGLIEVVTKESSAPGGRHEALAFHIGEVAVLGWPGEPGDRTAQVSPRRWMRAVDWVPYQRRSFVTPAFPGFISGHSTFSRAAAEVLTSITGSPYFPGGFAEWVAPKGTYLLFEKGPSHEVRLQWAAYSDASDQAGQSRLWGGIHIEPDDFVGRRVGYRVGRQAVAYAKGYFDGNPPEPPRGGAQGL